MNRKWERLYDVVNIDLSTANKLFKCYDSKATVSEIELLVGGRSTTNYKIKIKESDHIFVLRIYSKTDKSWCKEFSIQNMLKNNIPIPEIFYLDESKAIVNYPFSIVQFIVGITLDLFLLQKNNYPSECLFHNIGEILAIIHNKKYEKEGLLSETLNLIDGSLPPILSWYDHFLNSRAGIRLGITVKNRIYKALNNNKEELEQIAGMFYFSHGDFRLENIMVKNGNLTGVIDWENALSAPAYFDLGQFFRHEELITENLRESFINGYQKNATYKISDNWHKISKLMDLADILCTLDNKNEQPNLFLDMKILTLKTLEMLNC